MFYVYKTSTFFTFRIFALLTTSSSVLFRNFVKFQDQSFHTQKDPQMNLYLSQTSSVLIIVNISFYTISKCVFF